MKLIPQVEAAEALEVTGGDLSSLVAAKGLFEVNRQRHGLSYPGLVSDHWLLRQVDEIYENVDDAHDQDLPVGEIFIDGEVSEATRVVTILARQLIMEGSDTQDDELRRRGRALLDSPGMKFWQNDLPNLRTKGLI